MAEIRPFRGIRYNQERVGNLSAVFCPPYDVISPEEQHRLCEKSPYNIIRLELGKDLPGDTPTNNRYTRAAAIFQGWLEQGVLQVEGKAAFYLHQHRFWHQGQPKTRRSLLACVRLEEWGRGCIYPHENTTAEPKKDRLNLLQACQTNLSPIFALYDDPQQKVAAILEAQEKKTPILEAEDIQGEKHRVWNIADPVHIAELRGYFAPQHLFIADGHHRYETALAYRAEMSPLSFAKKEAEPFDFVLMSLVDARDPGLFILPVHRLVRGGAFAQGVRNLLEGTFHIESFPLEASQAEKSLEELLGRMRASGQGGQVIFGALGVEPGALSLLTLRGSPPRAPSGRSEAYARLEVSILQHFVLEGLLGVESVQAERRGDLVYVSDALKALRVWQGGEFSLAFFLNPVDVDRIKEIALSGEKMPHKSTYFYPKPPTGLVLYKLAPENLG